MQNSPLMGGAGAVNRRVKLPFTCELVDSVMVTVLPARLLRAGKLGGMY